MSPEFLQYFAGFFDGEGAIFVSKTSVRGYLSYRPRMEVSNTHLGVMQRIAIELNSSMSSRKSDGVRRIQYRVSIVSWDECLRYCAEILPHLIVKTKQAEVMVRWATHRLDQHADYGRFHSTFTHEEHEWYEELRTLNQRGVDANVHAN